MSLTSIAALCVKTAATFKDMYATTKIEIFSLCARGLLAITAQQERYSHTAIVKTPFWNELQAALALVCNEGCQEDLQAEGFRILEAVMLIMREASLRMGNERTKEEAELLAFFEQSGNWQANDGTLVSDYYYSRIPRTVQRKLRAYP